MYFEADNLCHIYNQGNNRQKNFFDRNNYLFFLKKIRTYVLPFADIIAWCLMPNHFRLLVATKSEDEEYPQICFDYIHVNPVSAGLVKNKGEWEFSSYMDYAGLRSGTIINKERGINFNIVFTTY